MNRCEPLKYMKKKLMKKKRKYKSKTLKREKRTPRRCVCAQLREWCTHTCDTSKLLEYAPALTGPRDRWGGSRLAVSLRAWRNERNYKMYIFFLGFNARILARENAEMQQADHRVSNC